MRPSPSSHGLNPLGSLKDALAKHPLLEVPVRQRLALLAASPFPAERRAATNIACEDGAPLDFFVDLSFNLTRAKATLDEVRNLVRNLSRAWQLKGRGARWRPTIVYGRAVPWDAFVQIVADERMITPIQAEQKLTRLLGAPPSDVHFNLGRTSLGRYLMWSTLDPLAFGDPFASIPMNAAAVRAALGLPQGSPGPLLLLRFTLGSATPPRCPTVADAYGADVWPYYFELNPLEDYGRTVCWDGTTNSRPEVVHKVIPAHRVCAPLSQVW